MVRQGLSEQRCEGSDGGSYADMGGGSVKGRGNSPAGVAQWMMVDL